MFFFLLVASALALSPGNESLHWGTYRPNLYFGTGTRSPNSLKTGLMWFNEDVRNMRHECNQNDDIIYAWNMHDGRTFGSQNIRDKLLNLDLTTDFVKVPHGTYGGDWVLRVTGKLKSPVSVVFYAGSDAGDSELMSLHNKMLGRTPDLQEFSITWSEKDRTDNAEIRSLGIPLGKLWSIKNYAQKFLFDNGQARMNRGYRDFKDIFGVGDVAESSSEKAYNVLLFQAVFKKDFQFDIVFQSGSNRQLDGLKFSEVTELIEERKSQFDLRFERIYGLKEKGYDSEHIGFAKMLLGNMIGSIGYFHGSHIVDRAMEGHEEFEPMDYGSEIEEDDYFADKQQDSGSVGPKKPNPQLEGPFSLFSAVPSRPFFPRGFLWDEGFHQFLISSWDPALSLEMIESWLNLMDDKGWIAREQILGDEARSRVPEEFQVQYPHFANPPTLIMSLMTIFDKEQIVEMKWDSSDFNLNDLENIRNYHLTDVEGTQMRMNAIFKKLRKQFKWFSSTQWGDIDSYGRENIDVLHGFRWRGRKGYHTLTSGLDDYPRTDAPHPGELHVDLMSWMGLYAKLLSKFASMLDLDADELTLMKDHREILDSLNKLHWDESSGVFCDLSVDENGKSYKIIHQGYINIFPLLLGLLPKDSPKLVKILEFVADPKVLWTSFGLTSLSQSDRLFQTGENYWRGPIWVNINFLVLRSLYKNYIYEDGPYRKQAETIYKQLRENIIKTVFNEYKRTGFVWEQYSVKGEGKRSHPFTGWTALVTLIMAEKF